MIPTASCGGRLHIKSLSSPSLCILRNEKCTLWNQNLCTTYYFRISQINTDLRRKTDGILRRLDHFCFQTKRKMKASPAVSHFQNVTSEKKISVHWKKQNSSCAAKGNKGAAPRDIVRCKRTKLHSESSISKSLISKSSIRDL